MKIKLIFIGLSILLAFNVHAAVKLGTALSSSTSGRTIPGIHIGIEGAKSSISLTAVGWKNSLGYMSAYQVNYHGLYTKGIFQAGLGWGLIYTQMGYLDDNNDDKATTRVDVATGPAIRSSLTFNWGFIQIDAMYGLRYTSIFTHILLSTQDSVQLSLGVKF